MCHIITSQPVPRDTGDSAGTIEEPYTWYSWLGTIFFWQYLTAPVLIVSSLHNVNFNSATSCPHRYNFNDHHSETKLRDDTTQGRHHHIKPRRRTWTGHINTTILQNHRLVEVSLHYVPFPLPSLPPRCQVSNSCSFHRVSKLISIQVFK